MAHNDKDKKAAGLQPMEITSPRTAGNPGPQGVVNDACCAPDGHSHDHAHGHDHDHDHGEGNSYVPTLISLLLLLSGLAFDYLGTAWFEGPLRFVWFGVAYVLVGWKVVKHAATNITKGNVFNEFFLMSLATLGAFYIGEYAEGVAVMLFYVIGEHFQESAVARSRKSIKDLIDNRPQTVQVVRGGLAVEVDPRKVKIGELIQVRAGERVALDGSLVSERSSFNTAALTGESRPDTKMTGERVLAGMINLDQVADIQVTSVFEDSALSRILKLVEQASSRKAKTQQFITKFAKVYTPIVVYLALGLTFLPYFFVDTYVFDEWLYRALIFLVISCPCALVVSIPLGYFGGIGAASRNGILFKGSNYLDQMRKVDTVVMDKTGTLTEGVFKVQEVVVEGLDREEFLRLLATLESKSTHPISQAVVAYAGTHSIISDIGSVEEIPGHGLRGKVGGREVVAGNTRLLDKYGISYNETLHQVVETIVLVAVDGLYAGHVTIADQVKEDALRAVQALHELGVRQVVMLSGDKDSIVQEVARSLKIDKAYGDLLPEDKVAKVEELKKQGATVAFVGDGINDAPVIALADVGVAMGGLGSDAAIETADVVIQNDQPSRMATAINIGKKTNGIVWQNISMAFGVKALVLLFGAFGVATMWEAVFADVGVAFLAILNAIRIQRMSFT